MSERDEEFVRRLIDWITNNADYEDIDDLCKQLGVPTEWFEHFYEWSEEEE